MCMFWDDLKVVLNYLNITVMLMSNDALLGMNMVHKERKFSDNSTKNYIKTHLLSFSLLFV